MTGPCILAGSCVWLLIGVPVILYLIIILPKTWELHPTLTVASLCLFAQMIALLMATSCSEPGVIPKRALIEALGTADELSEVLGYNLMGVGEPTRDPKVDAKGMLPADLQGKGYTWCRTCEIIRPPRASHCRECDQCVLRFDHHCPFVNNCIAQRNYTFFVGFLCSILCSAIFGLVVTMWWTAAVSMDEFQGFPDRPARTEVTVPVAKPSEDVDGGLTSGISMLIAVVGGSVALISVCVLCFLAYHIFISYHGQTTKEHIVKANVKDFGGTKALGARPTLWARRGPSLINPRAWVRPEALKQALEAARVMREDARKQAREAARKLREEAQAAAEAGEKSALAGTADGLKERRPVDPDRAERVEMLKRKRAQRAKLRANARRDQECIFVQGARAGWRRVHYSFTKGACPPRACWRREPTARDGSAIVHIEV